MKISIRNLLLIVSFIVGIIVLFVGFYLIYNSFEKIFSQQTFEHLETLAVSRAEHVKTFLKDQKNEVEMMAQSAVLRDLLVLEKNNLQYSEVFKKVQKRLKDTQNVSEYYFNNFLLDKKGEIIASSNEEYIGMDRSQTEYFIEGSKGVHLRDAAYSDITKTMNIVISAPLLDENKNLLGVYGITINIEKISEITKDRTGLEETGDMFIIDGEDSSVLTTSLYFKKEDLLVSKINTINSRSCQEDLKNYEENVRSGKRINTLMTEVFKDFRNISVLGEHAILLPETDWCLIAKIDESEALGIHRAKMIKLSFLIGVLIFAIILVCIYFISKLITQPIKKIQNNVESITEGNLEIELDDSKITEIQSLTDSLNRILASLKLAILRTGATKEQLGLGEAIKAKEEAEEKYKGLFENAVDAIFIADPETRKLVDCNKEAEKLMGYSKEKILSMRADELHPKDLIKETMEKFKQQAEGKLKIIYTEVLTKDGKRIPVEISASAVKIGEKLFSQGIFRDISKEKEAEEKYKLLYETSRDAIMTIEPPTWKFTAGNPAAIKMFNCKDEKEFTSLGPWDVSPAKQPDGKDSVKKAQEMIMKAMKEGSSFFEWTHKRYKGESFPATVLLTRFKLNGKDVVQATVRDMSKEELAKKELKRTDAIKNINIGKAQILEKKKK